MIKKILEYQYFMALKKSVSLLTYDFIDNDMRLRATSTPITLTLTC